LVLTVLMRMFFVKSWIERKVAAHAKDARPVAEVIKACGFRRLPEYFDAALLDRVRCVTVDRIPLPPLASPGLKFLGVIKTARKFSGITYGNTYFVDRKREQSESMHFHELIHAVQWDCLGFEKFLLAYGKGLVRNGYARNPFEIMAYTHQCRFETDPVPYPVEAAVREELQNNRTRKRKKEVQK